MKYLTDPRTAYLSARYDRKEEMVTVERVLQKHNILPGTPWLHQDTDIRNAQDDKERAAMAVIDVEGVFNADMLIMFTEDLTGDDVVPSSWARGGRHTELGIALASGVSIVIVGPRQNLLHFYDPKYGSDKPYEPTIRQFDTIEEFVVWYDENNQIPEDADVKIEVDCISHDKFEDD